MVLWITDCSQTTLFFSRSPQMGPGSWVLGSGKRLDVQVRAGEREVTGPPRNVSETPYSGPLELERHTAKEVSCTQSASSMEPPFSLSLDVRGTLPSIRPGPHRAASSSPRNTTPAQSCLSFLALVFCLVI